MHSIILKSPIGSFLLEEGRSHTIGRKGYDRDIEIDDSSASRMHGIVKVESGKLLIKDTDSLNGILVNQKPIDKGEWVELGIGDTIKIVSVEFVLDLGDSAEKTYHEPPSNDEPVFVPDPAVEPFPKPRVKPAFEPRGSRDFQRIDPVVDYGYHDFKERLKKKGKVTVGRKASNDIVLEDSAVSREHAVFTYEGGEYWVEDLQSTNGTFINGIKVERKTRIADADRIRVSLYSFSLLEGHEDLRETKSALSALEIQKVFPNGKVGLQPLSVEIPAGNFVALMGPPGCGKSTLLTCLNGGGPARAVEACIHD